MKTALAIRHVHFEDLGLLARVLRQAGYQVGYLEAGLDRLDPVHLSAADLLVVLGGPVGVYDHEVYPFLRDEIEALRLRLDQARPTLGICLGAQLMARALGERVYPSGVKELGWAPLELTGRASVLAPLDGLAVLHWHGDTFDLPDHARHLARTPAVANQAFSVGDHGLGLQFHLEVEVDRLERWYIGHACEIAGVPGIDVADLRRQAARHGPPLAAAAERVFADWLAGLPGLSAG
jgi:GMP synthase (glutamine-hydrolysing)